MEDLRLALAVEVCDRFGFSLFAGRCGRCSCPLVERPDQQLPFCWFCACDNKAATLARAVLLKAKLAAKGIIVEERPALPPPAANPFEAQGCLKLGMPL